MVTVPGYHDYAVDEDGDVYRVNYEDPANGSKHSLPHRLSPSLDKNGYRRVVLSVSGKRHYLRCCRLVALTLIPNPNGYPVVNHIDGDKTNDSVSNLEWATWRDNVIHAHATGLHKGCRTSVTLKNDETTLYFSTIVEASKYLGHDRNCFARHLTFDSYHGIIDGWDFELSGGKTRDNGKGSRS